MKKLIVIFLNFIISVVVLGEFETIYLNKPVDHEKFEKTVVVFLDEGKFPLEEDIRKIAEDIKYEDYYQADYYYITFILPGMNPADEVYAVSDGPEEIKINYDGIATNSEYSKYLKINKDGKKYLENISFNKKNTLPPLEDGVVVKLKSIVKNGFIRIKGETNLPEGMWFFLELKKNNFIFQELEITTRKNGEIETSFLGNYRDGENFKALKNGTYTLVITSGGVQKNEVEEIIGKKGEELSGNFIKYDPFEDRNYIKIEKKIILK